MTTSLLAPDEPPAVSIERAGAASPFVLTCDHAANRIPATLGDLGLPAAERDRHIAWDIGALGVARGLAERLDAVLVVQNYSRLVIDCNRHLWRDDAIPLTSEATAVPGNVDLPAVARAAREQAIWTPYHAAITSLLDARAAARRPTIYVSVHSFTPVYLGEERPWHIAVLSNRDRRMADPLLADLARDPALCVGDNIPYRLTDEGDYGVPVHAEKRGLPYVLLEIRQDEITRPEQQRAWAERLAPLLMSAARRILDAG